jgi:ABC-type multidrug transport system fused ATPase/permease subunit
MAKQALELIESVSQSDSAPNCGPQLAESNEFFCAEVEISNITFKYPSREKSAIQNISLKIAAGSSCAIIGPSGSGKTTLIDAALGIITPNSGEILLSKVLPAEAIKRWPGCISYVPQNINIINDSILENICFGYNSNDFSSEQIFQCLEKAELDTFIRSLPDGIHTQVGEDGSNLSGGQRQRLGIARALLLEPKLLILDEATSHLDITTESALTRSIEKLRGTTTVITVAHRLETIRNMDQILCLEGGCIVAVGDYQYISTNFPEFLERSLTQND